MARRAGVAGPARRAGGRGGVAGRTQGAGMRRLALSVIAVAAALVLQLTVVDRLPLPGGGPDLVLLAVVALGLTSGPMAGMLTGFLAGLALDIAPPASGVLGEDRKSTRLNSS